MGGEPIDSSEGGLDFVAERVTAKEKGLPENPLAMRDVGRFVDRRVAGQVILPVDENGDEDLAAALGKVECLVEAGLETKELLRGDIGVGEKGDACCGRSFRLDEEAFPIDPIQHGPADAVDGGGIGLLNERGFLCRGNIGHFNGGDPLVDGAEESAIAFSPSVGVQGRRGRTRDGVVDLLHRESINACDHLGTEVGVVFEFGGAGELGRAGGMEIASGREQEKRGWEKNCSHGVVLAE